MPPAGAKTKFFSSPLSTSADEPKYRAKYKELKSKLNEIEDDNQKLQVKILKSKKAIQRLRLERAILYDRLQASETPTNPFSLHTKPHLEILAPKDRPPTVKDTPTYAVQPPADKSASFLNGMNPKKLAAVQHGGETFAERPSPGVATGAAAPSNGLHASSSRSAAEANGMPAPAAQAHRIQHVPQPPAQAAPSAAVPAPIPAQLASAPQQAAPYAAPPQPQQVQQPPPQQQEVQRHPPVGMQVDQQQP